MAGVFIEMIQHDNNKRNIIITPYDNNGDPPQLQRFWAITIAHLRTLRRGGIEPKRRSEKKTNLLTSSNTCNFLCFKYFLVK